MGNVGAEKVKKQGLIGNKAMGVCVCVCVCIVESSQGKMGGNGGKWGKWGQMGGNGGGLG